MGREKKISEAGSIENGRGGARAVMRDENEPAAWHELAGFSWEDQR